MEPGKKRARKIFSLKTHALLQALETLSKSELCVIRDKSSELIHRMDVVEMADKRADVISKLKKIDKGEYLEWINLIDKISIWEDWCDIRIEGWTISIGREEEGVSLSLIGEDDNAIFDARYYIDNKVEIRRNTLDPLDDNASATIDDIQTYLDFGRWVQKILFP